MNSLSLVFHGIGATFMEEGVTFGVVSVKIMFNKLFSQRFEIALPIGKISLSTLCNRG